MTRLKPIALRREVGVGITGTNRDSPMDDRPMVRNVTYAHSVLEGTAYEAGRLPDEIADPVFWKKIAPGATQ